MFEIMLALYLPLLLYHSVKNVNNIIELLGRWSELATLLKGSQTPPQGLWIMPGELLLLESVEMSHSGQRIRPTLLASTPIWRELGWTWVSHRLLILYFMPY